MNFADEPLCTTRMALHCAPVGPMTNDSPVLLVRMLGSAALALPGSRRLGLNIGGTVLAADAGTCPSDSDATSSTAAARPRRITRAFIYTPPQLRRTRRRFDYKDVSLARFAGIDQLRYSAGRPAPSRANGPDPDRLPNRSSTRWRSRSCPTPNAPGICARASWDGSRSSTTTVGRRSSLLTISSTR